MSTNDTLKNDIPIILDNEIIPDAPISSLEAMHRYIHLLSKNEMNEIMHIKDIYYCAPNVDKKKYDPTIDNRYQTKYGDHILFRYKIIDKLGKGAFSNCYKVYDFKEKKLVALKILRYEPRFLRQGKIEIKILNYLKENDPKHNHNIIHIIDSFYYRNYLMMTFEICGDNLYQNLKNNNFVGYNEGNLKHIAKNILNSLCLLYDLRIIHADLKPENLVQKGSDVMMIDFGSSTKCHNKIHTYICSRYYRAPEITLGLGYDCSLDMWSFGCIIYELFIGKPLFPARNADKLIKYIVETIGQPPEKYMELLDIKYRNYILGVTDIPENYISNLLKSYDFNVSDNFVNFIESCVTWDKNDRLNPYEALRHQWLLN